MRTAYAILLGAAVCAASASARESAPEAEGNNPLNAVVKLEVQYSKPDFVLPWRTDTDAGDGSGVVVGDGRILTCAHCVADSTYIRVRKHNEDSLYHGEVAFIDNDCDLAIVRVDDPAFMRDVTPMEIGETPPVQSDVLAVGYPIGGDGISFTRGIVSRIEDRRYAHGGQTLLAAQVDAAINPGNSGGPVLDMETWKIGGIAFQGDKKGEALGYMIPAEILRRFFADAADGSIDSVPDKTFIFDTLESPAARRSLGMGEGQTGVLVNDVRGGADASPLRVGDVLMSIAGFNIANNGNIRIEGNEVRSVLYPFYVRQLGEEVPATILRDGAEMEITLPVRRLEPKSRRFMYDRAPDYYLLGGLVFTTASYNYIIDAKPDIHDRILEDKEFEGEEPVMISAVLPDKCMEGYLGAGGRLVRSLNGEKVKNLRHLVELVESFDGEFLRFALDSGDKWDTPMTLDARELREATPRVMKRYAIAEDRSEDLR